MRKLSVVLFCIVIIRSCISDEGEEASRKPNVLILFSDQHNKKVMAYEGHSDVITPHLDGFATESVVFDRAYCATGICAPSRAAMLTGINSRTLGLLTNSERTSVMREVVSLATVFKQNGYSTYAFGKRHTHDAIDEGWDVKKSHLCGESEDGYVRWLEVEGYIDEFTWDWGAEFGRGPKCSSYADSLVPTADLGTRLSRLPETHTMEAYTARLTIDMIREHSESGQPFFCWANFYRPHQPYTPLKKYMDLYDVSDWGEGVNKDSKIKKPESFYEPSENLPPLFQEQRSGGNKVWNMDKAYKDEQLWRNFIGAYYALVTEIDHYVGQILSELDETGMDKETIVIYVSDHGDFVGNHGMVEKAAIGHNVYEDILNVPLIIRYPAGFKGGKEIDELVSLTDIFPTLVELADLDMPELQHEIQGISLVDLIKNNTQLDREYLVSENWSQATVISKDFKLGIMLDPTDYARNRDYRYFGDMFFARETDPGEVVNAINDPHYAEEIKKLRAYFEDFKSKVPAIGKHEMAGESCEHQVD
ncbi:sulfatase [Bacteroidota bacterium]